MRYLSVIYSEKRRPYTAYPSMLCKYLVDIYFKPEYKTLLDIGCGRGEHLREFQKLGFQVEGVDISQEAKELSKDLKIEVADIGKGPLPFKDGSFDVVFSKSLIEHLTDPEHLIKEAYRVLTPGGRLITMTPDWESVYKKFYEDYTHKTPFTKESLLDIHRIVGCKEIQVRKFKQLPVIWKHPWLNIFSKIVSYLPESNIKFIKFSKRIMLLSCAEK